MKKNILFLSTLLASASLFATDYIYSGDGLQKLGVPQYDDVVLKLDENGTVNSDGLARFVLGVGGNDSKIINSLKTDFSTAKDTFKGLDLVWGFNINVRSNAGGEKEVLNLTGNTTFIGYSDGSLFRIYNYTGTEYPTNTTALAKFDVLGIKNASVFKFETNTRLVGNKLVVDHDSSGIWVSAGTLQYQVATTSWNKSKAFLQVDAGATFKMETPSTFHINKALIAGNFINETTNQVVFTAKQIYPAVITGNLFSKGRLVLTDGGAAEFAGDINFLYQKSKSDSILMRQTEKGATTLILSKENTFHSLTQTTESAYNSATDAEREANFIVREENGANVYYKKAAPLVVMTGGTGNTINVNATNMFGLSFSGCAGGIVEIASDATWVVSEWGNYNSAPVLTVKNFENDAIFLTETAMTKFEAMITDLTVITADSEEFKFSEGDIKFDAGTFDGMNGYWLTVPALAIPEPAEWAMILGGLALGLAIYRRRK